MDEEENNEESSDQLVAHFARALPVFDPPEEKAKSCTD